MLDQEALIRDLARLRRSLRRHPDDDVATVADDLAHAAGPTVRRAAAARLLGVSQTALDRWINSDDVPVVLTANGRREVPSDALVDLLDRVDRRRGDGAKHPLADELRARRERAESIDVDRLLPDHRLDAPHADAALRALAYHRAVAQMLDADQVAEAQMRLRRWRRAGRIHPRYAEAWEEILNAPVDEIARAISSDDARTSDLRQSSPFAGTLDEPSRRRVLALFDRAA